MSANRRWMDVTANNIANANTTKTPEGGPYKNKVVNFSSVLDEVQEKGLVQPLGKGVEVSQISDDPAPMLQVFNPSHPDADASGYVLFPNVNPMKEMANMSVASRSYQANVAAFNAGKNMFLKALEIGK